MQRPVNPPGPGVRRPRGIASARRRAGDGWRRLVHRPGDGHARPARPGDRPVREIPLGAGSAPHGVIVGPDGAPWITDGGQNAIVRVDPATSEVKTSSRCRRPARREPEHRHLRPATASSGSPARPGSTAASTRASARSRCSTRPAGRGPYGITATPDGEVYYASLAGSHIARIDPGTGEATRHRPAHAGPGRPPGLVRLARPRLGQRVERRPGRPLRPGDGEAGANGSCPARSPQAYAVYVDDRDIVWLSDFGANAIVRFDPATETFTRSALPSADAAVRQLLGRPGEVWGAESGATSWSS